MKLKRAFYLRYIGGMIQVEIKKAAQRAGIKNAYQFQKVSSFPPAMAARIFKGAWTRIDISTLNTICNVLRCTPNDILSFTPDSEDEMPQH